MSAPVEIAKAIEDLLKEAHLSQTVVIRRTYDLVSDQENLGDGIRILIAQGGKKAEQLDREAFRKTFRIDIGIHSGCLCGDTDRGDMLIDLTEEVIDLITETGEMAGYPCNGVEPKTQWAPPLMQKANTFLSVHTLLYEA